LRAITPEPLPEAIFKNNKDHDPKVQREIEFVARVMMKMPEKRRKLLVQLAGRMQRH
jgi:hypothetical protein